MSEWRQHRNPWAEKLSQVSLPDGGESWKAMEAVLDREMPTGRRRDWRRWVLLILLLLLLIGVCNCPGRKWFFSGKREVAKTEVSKTETDKTGDGETGDGKMKKASFPEVPSGEKVQGAPSVDGVVSGDPSVGGAVPGSPSVGRVVPESATGDSAGLPGRQVVTEDSVSRRGTKTGGVKRVPAMSGTTVRRPKRRTGDRLTPGGQEENDSLTVTSAATTTKLTNAPPAAGTSMKTPAAMPKDGEKKKGGEKKDGEKKMDDDKKEKQGGWMVGIGLNQFFTVGSQQASSFNSGGITGTLADYIPVPMVRYYFNPKLYVQLEAQINTPQYTKKNLVAVSTPVDSIGTTTGGATVTLQQSVAINKLFYFNVPLSVHYTVFDHLDLGAGLQYSRLTNGVGVFNSNYNNGSIDSLSTETKSFKGDSVYREIKTHEFRFLVDANYNWKHFIFGIRYNQALSKFIHVEISPGQITQARNSSLQLYLRYILWDGRKKTPLLPAK
jgi:hypothetical protein